MLRRVQQAALWPHHCAVIPFKGSSNTAWFIDTGTEIGRDQAHVYISPEGAVEIAKEIGWSGPGHIRDLEARIVALESELEAERKGREDAERQLEAIDFLGSRDFITRQKRGPRASKQKKEANV